MAIIKRRTATIIEQITATIIKRQQNLRENYIKQSTKGGREGELQKEGGLQKERGLQREKEL